MTKTIDKYNVVNTLFSDQNQSVYYVTNSLDETNTNLIMNEIKDKKVVAELINVFLDGNEALKNNFIEFFFKESQFYVVSSISPGETLGNIILKTNLTEDDKIRIAGSFLRELNKLILLPFSIQQVLCNFGNIAVDEHKEVHFNHFLNFTKEDFLTTKEDIIAKTGDIIAAIYMNSLYFQRDDINKLPAKVTVIINRCLNKEYTSVAHILADFEEYIKTQEQALGAYGLEHLFERNRVFLTRREEKVRRSKKERKRQLFNLLALLLVVIVAIVIVIVVIKAIIRIQ
jgi:hypothetical protein